MTTLDRDPPRPAAVLMLTPRMVMGYGVAEAVAMQTRGLRARGINAVVGCLTDDGTYGDVPIRRVAPDRRAVADLAAEAGAPVVIAHASPFYEVLPGLTGPFWTIAYEYGDPTPELFTRDSAQRRAVVEHKRTEVYPAVSAVAAISEFIRRDIDWPQATIIRLGVDHVPDLGLKKEPAPGPLRVGALMRLGPGEARYKGTEALRDLAAGMPQFEWRFAGRGTEADAAQLRQAGVRVVLNPGDAARSQFLRDLDVFVTLSRWEGMNLPLVEAEALGTPALALTTGAHAEFAPRTYGSVTDLADALNRYDADRSLLVDDGREAYELVRGTLSWQSTVTEVVELMAGAPGQPPPLRARWRQQVGRLDRFRRSLVDAGIRSAVTDQWERRIRRRSRG